MGGIGIAVAFVGGIVSFASPCCLPLVPAYVGYILGTAPGGAPAGHRSALTQSLAFVLGFSVVFVALWASVGVVGYVLRDYGGILRQLGGAVLVFLGLHVAGLIDVAALYREVRVPIGPFAAAEAGGTPGTIVLGGGATNPSRTPSHARSMLLGVAFAAGWTPCVGPILAGIIGLASLSASVAEGTLLLAAYAAGLAIPFVLVAVGAASVHGRIGWLRAHDRFISGTSGALLAVVGLLMVTNTFVQLSALIGQLA